MKFFVQEKTGKGEWTNVSGISDEYAHVPTLQDLGWRSAACGLVPAHGWGLDSFVMEKCQRCERALRKLDAPAVDVDAEANKGRM